MNGKWLYFSFIMDCYIYIQCTYTLFILCHQLLSKSPSLNFILLVCVIKIKYDWFQNFFNIMLRVCSFMSDMLF